MKPERAFRLILLLFFVILLALPALLRCVA